MFDTTKLEWMNGQYLSMLPPPNCRGPLARYPGDSGVGPTKQSAPLIDAVKARSRTIIHLAEQVAARLPGAKIVRG